MGLLDRFKKESPAPNKATSMPQVKQPSSHADFKMNSGGFLQVDFFDSQADYKQFYDMTRLIVENPININGHQVYNCKVSWYGSSDCQIVDKNSGEFSSPRAKDCRQVLAQIDLNLLQTDPNYCNMVMTGLLDRKRVERYLSSGLEESPKQPCGQYIGGVRQTQTGYGKFFDLNIGKLSHNSTAMKFTRQLYKESIQRAKENSINKKQEQINKLQNDINELSNE